MQIRASKASQVDVFARKLHAESGHGGGVLAIKRASLRDLAAAELFEHATHPHAAEDPRRLRVLVTLRQRVRDRAR